MSKESVIPKAVVATEKEREKAECFKVPRAIPWRRHLPQGQSVGKRKENKRTQSWGGREETCKSLGR